ncbi:MAG: glycerophosphodiester phosphodiesterase [Longimicrobiales bacterium]
MTEPTVPRPSTATVIAHRGFSAKAPENTLSSVRAASLAGADGVEWDISTASCGTPVLFHDANLGRTTNGVGPVRRRTLAQLKGLDAGTWFDPSFEGEQIPSLAEACQLLNELDFQGVLLAEVKGWREMEDVDRMVEVVEAEGRLDTTRFIAIDWTTIDRIARVFPGTPVAFIVERPERFDEGLERAIAKEGAGLAVDYRILLEDESRVERANAADIPLGVWTVDDTEAAARLHELGIRDFTTDEVETLLAWKAEL